MFLTMIDLGGLQEFVDALERLVNEGKKNFADLSRNEFKQHFINNKRLLEKLAPHWTSFAIRCGEFIGEAELKRIEFKTVPTTEKLIDVLNTLYNCSDDVSLQILIEAVTCSL